MPELPEVEIVRRGLIKNIPSRSQLQEVVVRNRKLRFPVPHQIKKLSGLTLESIERRAKYLVWDWGNTAMVSHLGMTGAWRKQMPGEILTVHDHLLLKFRNHGTWIYRDPRRFGFFDVIPARSLGTSRWFKHLGPEPLSKQFSGEYLSKSLHGRKGPIKSALMNQQIVVGVGNIYASEILFLSGIRPLRRAGQLKPLEIIKLVGATKKILKMAIQRGGSTIQNYRNAENTQGQFQESLRVYGRAQNPCLNCGNNIESMVIAGRSTYWCPQCQK